MVSTPIRPDSFSLLDELGKALTSEKLNEKLVIVKGHTDSDGEDAYNLELSLNRANAQLSDNGSTDSYFLYLDVGF